MAPADPSGRFNALVDEFLEEFLGAHPTTATFLGVTKFDSASTDMSAAAIRARDARQRHWLRTFENVGPRHLNHDQQVDRELILASLGAAVQTASFEGWRRNPEEYLNDGVFDLFVHQARPEDQAVAAAVDRLAAVPATVASAKKNLSPALADPLILRRDLASVRGQAEFLRSDVGDFVSDPALRAQLLAAAAPAAAAYDELGDHIEKLEQRATGSFVFGEARYNAVLQTGEMLSHNARTLRDMGQAEYDAIVVKMGDVAQRMTGSRDWKPVLASLQATHASDMPGMLADYRAATARARQFVIDKDLMSVPASERCAVEPAPAFMRSSTAVASYFPPAPFLPGTRGTFNVPYTPDGADAKEMSERLESNAEFEIPSTTAHEAYPGHHLHFVHMANATMLRQVLESTFFVEGWALDAEQMMADAGFFRSDAELMGQLSARLMRAARIVVDTSLHMGEMTLDQASDFMRDGVGLPPSVARAEALRYAAWPTQASAYLTGANEIAGARRRWLAEGKGTVREFNDAITDQGALPPGLAIRAIGLTTPPAAPDKGLAA